MADATATQTTPPLPNPTHPVFLLRFPPVPVVLSFDVPLPLQEPTTAQPQATTTTPTPEPMDTDYTTQPSPTTPQPQPNMRRVVVNFALPPLLFLVGSENGMTMPPNFPSFEDILNQSFLYHQQQRSGPAPPTQQQIEQFVKEKVLETLPEGDAGLCTVCQDNFKQGEKVITLPCAHIYHTDCGMPWLKEHNSCPLCRASLPSIPPKA